MAITITKKKEVADEQDALPDDQEPEEVVEPKKSERERELEIELAEKRGELKALKSAGSGGNGQMSLEQTKQLVFADINNLTDEDFQKKYKTSKHAASMTVMDADSRQTKAEAKQLHAEANATSELSAEFGSDFYKFKDRILEAVEDLSPEARQDPSRLKRWMKSQYLALSTQEPDKVVTKDTSRRKIVKDFEPPTTQVVDKTQETETDEVKDEVPEGSDISNQRLAHYLDIHSEKERKEIAGKWGPGTEKGETVAYVDMDLTCNDPAAKEKIMFRNPKRGFERVKVA